VIAEVFHLEIRGNLFAKLEQIAEEHRRKKEGETTKPQMEI
jgi:hypothetical protein